MATHSSVLVWRILGMGEPGGLLSMGLHRVGHNWRDLAAAAAYFIVITNDILYHDIFMLQSVKISIENKKLNKKEEFWNSIFHDQKLRGKYHNNELEIYYWDFFKADSTLNNILQ